MINNEYKVIGVMSGTSLDGIDLALCKFSDTYTFDLLHFKTIPYSEKWKNTLCLRKHWV